MRILQIQDQKGPVQR